MNRREAKRAVLFWTARVLAWDDTMHSALGIEDETDGRRINRARVDLVKELLKRSKHDSLQMQFGEGLPQED